MRQEEEPVLVKIVDDFGHPDYHTPEGQTRLNIEAVITGVFLVLGTLGLLGVF